MCYRVLISLGKKVRPNIILDGKPSIYRTERPKTHFQSTVCKSIDESANEVEVGTSNKAKGVKNNLHLNAHNSDFKGFPVVKLLVRLHLFAPSPQASSPPSPMLPLSWLVIVDRTQHQIASNLFVWHTKSYLKCTHVTDWATHPFLFRLLSKRWMRGCILLSLSAMAQSYVYICIANFEYYSFGSWINFRLHLYFSVNAKWKKLKNSIEMETCKHNYQYGSRAEGWWRKNKWIYNIK